MLLSSKICRLSHYFEHLYSLTEQQQKKNYQNIFT